MSTPPVILGVIPARYGSSRLPAKPLTDLGGKTMIQRVYERASQSRLLTRLVVATDHDEILKNVRSFGGDALMTSSSLPSGTDRVAYVASKISDATIIVNIQGDEPLLEPELIDLTIRPLLENKSVKLSTPATKIDNPADLTNPAVVKLVVDLNGNALYFSRAPIPWVRQEPDPVRWLAHHRHYRHVGLYVYRRAPLCAFPSWGESQLEKAEKLEQLRFLEHGYSMRVVEVECASISVDTAEDADKVRSILRKDNA